MLDVKFIEELKSRNEIVDVISAYCQLERKGGAFWARCPLPGHMEKTPSFCVNQAGQFYKCFGCQRGGDVIKFIMEVESLTYYEAIKFLANRANMEVPGYDTRDEERIEQNALNKKNRLAVLKDTARFYVNNLYTEGGAPYLDYIFGRGFDKKTLVEFGIGCSLDYKSLPNYLHEKGHSYEDMVAAGVVSYNKDTGDYSDFEAKRLVVPIIDSFSNVLAFGGRALGDVQPKYLNTSDTPVFNKRLGVYAANLLKKERNLKRVILVEGYMDVVSLTQFGVTGVCATLGTAQADACAC